MLNDEETMRCEFFDESHKWREDIFTLFGEVGTKGGKDPKIGCVNRYGQNFSWNEALEKLALLEEGYFPYDVSLNPMVSSSPKTTKVDKYRLEECHYKIKNTSIIDGETYSFGYMALSDVENYINFRKSIGGFLYSIGMYEQTPQEVRNLFYDGKVTIGIPYGQDVSMSAQVMTIQEAREFMNCKMEERFQKYWEGIKKR